MYGAPTVLFIMEKTCFSGENGHESYISSALGKLAFAPVILIILSS